MGILKGKTKVRSVSAILSDFSNLVTQLRETGEAKNAEADTLTAEANVLLGKIDDAHTEAERAKVVANNFDAIINPPKVVVDSNEVDFA